MSLLHAKYVVYISPCHEIHDEIHADFMKSAGFHEIQRISWSTTKMLYFYQNTDIYICSV